jgi:septal ring factor EnvC (AmiA/AmiB activator)
MLAKPLSRFLILVSVASLGFVGCSNKATEEQMKTLRDLDSQRSRLQSDLDRANSTLRDLQTKLAAQDKELSDCQRDMAAVRQGLSTWPNIWPDEADWNPPPPPEPVAPTGKKKK